MAGPTGGGKPSIRKISALFYALLVLFLGIAAFLLVPVHTHQYSRQAVVGMSALARSRAAEMARWRDTVVRSGAEFGRGNGNAGKVKAIMAVKNEEARHREFLAFLAPLQKEIGFSQGFAILHDSDQALSETGSENARLDNGSLVRAYESLDSGTVYFDDNLFRDPAETACSLFIPLMNDRGKFEACLLLRIKPADHLGPLFAAEASSSLETLMLARRRDAYEVILRSGSGEDKMPYAAFKPYEASGNADLSSSRGTFIRTGQAGGVFVSVMNPVAGTNWAVMTERDFGLIKASAGKGALFVLIPFVILLGATGTFLAAMIIRQRRLSEAELAAAAARADDALDSSLRITLNTAPNPAFRRDLKGKLINCNAAFEKLVGLPEPEMIGRDLEAVIRSDRPPDPSAPDGPGDRSTRVYELSIVSHEEERHDLIVAESFITCADGTVREAIGHVIDITQRKKSEQEIRQLKDFSDETIRHMTEGLILTDDAGRVTFVNQAAADMLGYGIAEMSGVNETDLVAEDQREILSSMDERRAMGFSDHYELDFLRKDNTRRTFLVSSGPRMSGGVLLGTMAILTDITDRKRMEAEIRALSLTDDLTGLTNRRGFMALARQQLKMAVRMDRKAILFFLDVDGLKSINDSFGHRRGDQALVDISSLLKRNFRDSDILARLGGDEFVVLAMEETETEPTNIVKRLQGRIDVYNSRAALEKSFTLAFSIGYVTYDPEFPLPLDDLLAKADFLMYEDKKAKKGR